MAATIKSFSRHAPACTNICRLKLIHNCMSLQTHSVLAGGHEEVADKLDFSLVNQTDQPAKLRSVFRTSENEPANHNNRHVGMYYTVPREDMNKLFTSMCLGSSYISQVKTFTEACIMVRQPALEIMSYIKSANYSCPPVKYVLYGNYGCGKTMTMAHVIHYCTRSDWIILYIPWLKYWGNFCKEVIPSSFKSDRIDLPVNAVEWLVSFERINKKKLQELDLKTTNTYVWTKREQNEEGTPLLQILEYGISRPKFASDVIGVILKEIRLQSNSNRFKTLLAIDGINALWAQTKIKTDTKKLIPPEGVSFFHHVKNMFRSNWTNGVIMMTADNGANDPDKRLSHLPHYVLGKEGFDMLEPFIPVEVTDYSNKEMSSCLEYYIDRKWITNPKGSTDAGKKELTFLTGKNPEQVMKVAGHW